MKRFLQNNIKYLALGAFIVVGRLLGNKWATKEWKKAQSGYAIALGVFLVVLLAGICVGLIVKF